jgi:hypothetical protein
MKINVWFIVSEHIKTLSVDGGNGESKKSAVDISIFYLLPLALGFFAWWFCFEVKEAVYELSVSVFAIFSALLLSVQVAMYGVFRSERKISNDKVIDEASKAKVDELRGLLCEINTNISYLILVSCIAVSIFLLFFAVRLPPSIETGLLIAIYAHFILTVAMVLKRAHLVFDAEYRSPS